MCRAKKLYFRSIVLIGAGALAAISANALAAGDMKYASHEPTRPLPTASNRPMDKSRSYFVDAAKGNDAAAGSLQKPWKTVNAAAGHLKPGNTLYLRAGTYYEAVTLHVAGAKDAPITVRAYPNELAIIDGGIREFFEDPANAWEPVTGGAPDEYQSKKTYTAGGGFGNFGDSMLPFQRYLTMSDLRSSNELFRKELDNRADDPVGIYAGPGVHRDTDGHIHIRLAHTELPGLGENAYTGETDPRKLQLVIDGNDIALNIAGSENLRVQDVVVRGGHREAVRVEKSTNIELDGLTIYGSTTGLRIGEAHGLRLLNSALHGHAAPWHSRFHHKDRSKSGYLFFGSGENVEFANCEFTDHHDGLQINGINGFQMHHCLIENFNDDGIEPGPKKAQGKWLIYCNYMSRCLSPFTAHGKTPQQVESEEGSGMYVFRNILDFREGTYYGPPEEADPTGAFLQKPTEAMIHDHGSPLQQNYYVYQNTFIMRAAAFRSVYALSWGGRATQTIRRVFNNICFEVDGIPGMVVSVAATDDFQADGNLSWSLHEGPNYKPDLFFAQFRSSEMFKNSKKTYPAGWTSNDLFADPHFLKFDEDYHQPSDLRLAPDSPAANAGVPLPENWPDPVRAADAGKPDIGAIPAGVEPWRIGFHGRYSALGQLIGHQE